jgi:hypothetical protein
MGAYGGGVEGNCAVVGARRKLPALATVVVVEAVVGGIVADGAVVTGDTVVAIITVVETGSTVVVGLDA